MGGGFVRYCADCGAPVDADQPACWMCGAAMSPARTVPAVVPAPIATHTAPQPVPRQAQPPPLPPPSLHPPAIALVGDRNPWQFSIASLFALMTLAAVCLGVALRAPGLAIALAIAAAPALVRTFGISSMWRKAGQPLTLTEQCLTFGGSMLVVMAVAASAATTFVAVCAPLAGMASNGFGRPRSQGIGQAMEIGAWVLGIVAALTVSGIALYSLWLSWHVRFRKEGKPPTFEE
jgi:hypothetical protein